MCSRKYKQKGYQEDERPERSGRREPRRSRGEGPRGRGLGAPTASVFRCRDCGAKRALADPILLDTACPKCSADLHSCVNCAYFDTSSPNECRKPVVRRIAKKAKRNECELFEPKTVQEFESQDRDPSDPRAAFDALFK